MPLGFLLREKKQYIIHTAVYQI